MQHTTFGAIIKKSLSLKKAPGIDLLTAELLVQLPNNIFEAIAEIINACFRFKYIPYIKSLAVFPQACICKRVVLVVFVALVHARAFWKALFTR